MKEWLIEKKVTLADGSEVLWSYDKEGDFLEVFFQRASASNTVELAEGLFLRFDKKTKQALSLGIVSAATFLQPQEFGPRLLSLDGLKKLPEPDRKLILQMLQSLPLRAILKLYSFEPVPRKPAIPMASLDHPLPIAI